MNYHPSPVRVWEKFFADGYRHLGKLLLSNLLWTLSFVPTLWLLRRASFLVFLWGGITFLLTTPVVAGMYWLTSSIVWREREAELRDFFIGLKKLWLPTLSLLVFTIVVLEAGGLAIFFYWELFKTHSLKGFFFLAFSCWILLSFFFVRIYFFPLLVTQKMKIRSILKNSFLLALDNLGFTGIIVLEEIIFLFLFLYPSSGMLFSAVRIVFFLVGVSLFSLFENEAFLEVARKYLKMPPLEEKLLREKTLFEVLKEAIKPWEYQ